MVKKNKLDSVNEFLNEYFIEITITFNFISVLCFIVCFNLLFILNMEKNLMEEQLDLVSRQIEIMRKEFKNESK